MGTKRTRIGRHIAPTISETELFILSDGLLGQEENRLVKFALTPESLQALWKENRDFILREYAEQRPGTRPQTWWDFDSPAKVRNRLGGVGDPAHEHLAYVEHYVCGIPDLWITQDDVDMYNGRQKTIDGEPITCHGAWLEGHFKGRAIDLENPPRYESQAAFLKRLDLLLPGEEQRLSEADFEPEVILPEGTIQ